MSDLLYNYAGNVEICQVQIENHVMTRKAIALTQPVNLVNRYFYIKKKKNQNGF